LPMICPSVWVLLPPHIPPFRSPKCNISPGPVFEGQVTTTTAGNRSGRWAAPIITPKVTAHFRQPEVAGFT
jgi:hypothetical protein